MTDADAFCTAEAAGAIKAIDKHSVHQICSGQVILSLATAVKELVENSIDAGASSVEIKLKDFGAELVEVSDNGRGVEEENFEGLTLKHHTSKLRDFSDLTHVETFGFRGEALSSLCALSDVTVVTCHEMTQVGSRLVFDHGGHLTRRCPHPRQQGTTVSLQQLFRTLPVRHREFQRNIKKEYSKMIHVLQAYCIISTGVRITCSNQVGQGRRSTVLATSGGSSMRDNIGAVFGPKQLQTLLPIQQQPPVEAVMEEFSLGASDLPSDLFTISGFISRGDHGVGRSSTDRQFYFINKRPCDPAKVSKVVNEVYHTYNRHQYPFVSLNITVASECVDVNVTPDKRQVFLQQEKLLLAIVKTSLLSMFETGVNKLSINTLTTLNTTQLTRASRNSETCEDSFPLRSPDMEPERRPASWKPAVGLAALKAAFSLQQPPGKSDSREPKSGPTQKKMELFLTSSEPVKHTPHKLSSLSVFRYEGISESDTERSERSSTNSVPERDGELESSDGAPEKHHIKSKHSQSVDLICSVVEPSEQEPSQIFLQSNLSPNAKKLKSSGARLDAPVTFQKKTVMLDFCLKDLSGRMQKVQQRQKAGADGQKFRRFRAKINPAENQNAEEELKKEISKDMFKEMEIIGQFNLGFIITKLNSDLFMIDQHATDEKYNFEMLQQHTVLQGQRLIQPQNLHLTAVSETVLIENLEIFQKNGFDFQIDEDVRIGRLGRVTLRNSSSC
ncbi:mismatch repair endonuclease PMS2 isoform X2 [Denticeps clupeoides]|uniref:mismatch repair endonuclease PMS2 isoform X2 n=1 Tax=Denticeps clupeoides TaxID=299321 RepID=UPI0010A47755|nr:mismatch repair endonuclease PMS2 isoform X2 [Denticeps clupeoides]